jgi:hypothetical protein
VVMEHRQFGKRFSRACQLQHARVRSLQVYVPKLLSCNCQSQDSHSTLHTPCAWVIAQ